MTTFHSEVIGCAVCGTVSSFRALSSTSAFGSFDLDLRPPPLQRHTMEFWQQECPSCGYVNVTIGTPLEAAADIVHSPEFAALRAASDEPALVNRFKRHALLVADEPIQSGWTLLHAAWVCDDLGLWELAKRCREDCVDLWSSVDYGHDEDSARMQSVLVDVLRRAERFDEADLLIDIVLRSFGVTPAMIHVMQFQRRLVGSYDSGVYTVEQALTAMGQTFPNQR
jgi:hypothetical protein